jgi:hypothetical protein
VADPKLTRRAGVAISIAMQNDEYGHRQLERYLGEFGEADLERLADAAQAVADTAGDALGRRHS